MGISPTLMNFLATRSTQSVLMEGQTEDGFKKDLRKVKTKLAVVKGLGESDSDDDDAGKWVERQKKKVKEKEEAEKRAKAMAELDEEFGVQDIVEEGMKNKQQEEYTSKDLKGMRVEHKAEAFGEADTVLTLQ